MWTVQLLALPRQPPIALTPLEMMVHAASLGRSALTTHAQDPKCKVLFVLELLVSWVRPTQLAVAEKTVSHSHAWLTRMGTLLSLLRSLQLHSVKLVHAWPPRQVPHPQIKVSAAALLHPATPWNADQMMF